MCVLLRLSPLHWLPVQSERGCRAPLSLSISREGPGGGANRPPLACHYKVRLQAVESAVAFLDTRVGKSVEVASSLLKENQFYSKTSV